MAAFVTKKQRHCRLKPSANKLAQNMDNRNYPQNNSNTKGSKEIVSIKSHKKLKKNLNPESKSDNDNAKCVNKLGTADQNRRTKNYI